MAAKRPRRASASGSAYGACPLCGASVHLALLESHAAECTPEALPPPAPAQPSRGGRRAGPRGPPPLDGGGGEGADAFAVLFRAQRALRVDRVRFHLEFDAATRSFSWLYAGARGAAPAPSDVAPPAWGAEVDVAVRGLRARIHVTTNVPPAAGGSGWAGGPGADPCSAAVLKSALQKNVRRCRPGPASRCAARLAAVDPKGLVRRLPVVLVEDALPHPSLPLLAWLLLADARGYAPGGAHLAEVVKIAADAARVPYRLEPHEPDEPDDENRNDDDDEQGGAGREEAVLARSLRMRAAFGGTKFDVAMLLDAADRLARQNRQGGDASCDSLLKAAYLEHHHEAGRGGGPSHDDHDHDDDHDDDVPMEAVDQHCSGILTALQAECPGVSADLAARAIWEMSSGVSLKRPWNNNSSNNAPTKTETDADVLDAWTRIEPAVRGYQRRYLLARGGRSLPTVCPT